MAFKLKLPGFLAGAKAKAGQIDSATTVMEDVQAVRPKKASVGLSFFGRYSVNQQLQILGGILGVAMVALAVLEYAHEQRSTDNTAYVAAAGEMRMISQRLAKASTLAMQGEPFAFDHLNDLHKTFADYLNPDSLKVLPHCKLEPGLKDAVPGTHYQFERKGFFTVDMDSKPGKPVFNLTATLRDSWAKIEKKS